MPLILDIAPANDPVTLAEVMDHIRVTDSNESAAIDGYISAAIERLDGRDGLLGRCLITQVWKLTLDCFTNEIEIPLPPCQAINAVTYTDPDGIIQTLAPSEYQVLSIGAVEGAKLRPAYGVSWPAICSCAEAVTITFTAGFGDDPVDVPDPIRTAIKMHTAYLYDNRDGSRLPDEMNEYIRNHKEWIF